jgi:hypothetical protein
MEVEQRYVIKFFVEEGMKRAEIIDPLNKDYGRDALQRMQVHDSIKDLKSGSKDLPNIPPPGREPDNGLDKCIGKALKQDPHLSTRKKAKALNISSTTVQNQLT